MCARSTNRLTAAEAIPEPMSSEGTGHNCSSASPNPSRLVATIRTVVDAARMASIRSAAASKRCSQLSNTNSRTRPSSASATDSATVFPGCWVMPSTAATASGTAAGSVTAASSKNHTPSGNSSTSRAGDFGREAGLADPAHPGQRDQPMSLYRGLHLAGLGLAPDEARRAGRRFPGPASSARNGGNSVRRPGTRT